MASMQELANTEHDATAGGKKVLLVDASGDPILTTTDPGVVQGAAADNAAASGNPILAGGKYNASDPTYDDGDAATLQVDSAGKLKTLAELTGRNVEVVTVYDALAITDTTPHISSVMDVSAYRRFAIMARCSLDQEVVVQATSHAGAQSDRATQVWDTTSSGFTANTVTIPILTDRWYAIHSEPGIRSLIELGFYSIRFSAKASIAPTTGSLTLQIWGVPN